MDREKFKIDSLIIEILEAKNLNFNKEHLFTRQWIFGSIEQMN